MGRSTRKNPSRVEDGGELRFLGVKDGKLQILDLSDAPEPEWPTLDMSKIPELDLTGIPTFDDLLKELSCRKRRGVV